MNELLPQAAQALLLGRGDLVMSEQIGGAVPPKSQKAPD